MEIETMSHVKWICKYHIIITPKYRKKVMYGKERRRGRGILRELARRKGIRILEGEVMPDHVHLALSIPPKYSVSNVIGYLKGKSAILLHQDEGGKYCKKYWKKNFWSRGYYVSTLGLDENTVKEYIRKQEYLDKKSEGGQLNMGWK